MQILTLSYLVSGKDQFKPILILGFQITNMKC